MKTENNPNTPVLERDDEHNDSEHSNLIFQAQENKENKSNSHIQVQLKTDTNEGFSQSKYFHRGEEQIEKYIDTSITIGSERNKASILKQQKQNSMWTSFVLSCQIAMGIDMFALPHALSYVSFFYGILLTIMYGVFTLVTLNMLAYVVIKKEVYEYSSLVRTILGKRVELFFNIILFVSCFLNILAYINIEVQILGSSLYEFFYSQSNEYSNINDFLSGSFWSSFETRMMVIYLFTLVILIPLCMQKEIGELELISYLGLFSLAFMLIVIILQTPFFYEHYLKSQYKPNKPDTHANWFSISESFSTNLSFFTSNAILMYSYDLQFSIVPIYKSLKDNNIANCQSLNFYTLLTTTVTFTTISVFGFLTVPLNPPEFIIFRNSVTKGDMLMSFGKVLIGLCVSGQICMYFNSIRLCFFQIVRKSEEFSSKENILFVLFGYLTVSTLCIFFEKTTLYLSLIGAFTSVFYCYLFPGLMYVLTNDHEKYSFVNVSVWLMTMLFTVLGLTAGVIDIINTVEGRN